MSRNQESGRRDQPDIVDCRSLRLKRLSDLFITWIRDNTYSHLRSRIIASVASTALYDVRRIFPLSSGTFSLIQGNYQ